jgi:hypothetical protein
MAINKENLKFQAMALLLLRKSAAAGKKKD